jgi:hypothetical protein
MGDQDEIHDDEHSILSESAGILIYVSRYMGYCQGFLKTASVYELCRVKYKRCDTRFTVSSSCSTTGTTSSEL